VASGTDPFPRGGDEMTTDAAGSSWKDAEVARRFLDQRRRAIPLGDEQIEVMLRLVRHFVPEPRSVVDLGCGDGFLARAVLSEFPGAHAMLLDHSEPMLERAHGAMRPFSGRYEVRHGDLAESLPGLVGDGPFDLIVSGYAIHHLPTPRKRALYAEVFGLLRPGGLFVNVEHVASATPELEGVFDGAYIDHLAAVTGRDRAQVEAEHHARTDKADNILEPVEAQVGWLREIGYDQADCYFKWLELAVFGGVRPGDPARFTRR
jgi:tRNA (cmo5U34)-methyltransferase